MLFFSLFILSGKFDIAYFGEVALKRISPQPLERAGWSHKIARRKEIHAFFSLLICYVSVMKIFAFEVDLHIRVQTCTLFSVGSTRS